MKKFYQIFIQKSLNEILHYYLEFCQYLPHNKSFISGYMIQKLYDKIVL